MERNFELAPAATNTITGKVQTMFVGSVDTQLKIAGVWLTLPRPDTANYAAMLQAANDCTLFQVTPTITYDGSQVIQSITIPTGN